VDVSSFSAVTITQWCSYDAHGASVWE